jgi:serine/threonine protein kinase
LFLRLQLDQELNIKVTDFGLIKTRRSGLLNEKSVFAFAPWAAPECLTPKRIKERSEKADVYSFGVIVWELVTRSKPWSSTRPLDIIELVTGGKRLDIPSSCPELLSSLICDCWKDGNFFLRL